MLRNVFTKSVWDLRRSLLGWGIGFAVVTIMYAGFYPSIKDTDTAALMESYPDALKEAFDFTDVTSAAGYLNSSVFGILAPLLMLVYSAMLGSRSIAGDEENGTLELQLAHPVSRTSLLLQRFATVTAIVVAIGAVVLLALLAISGPAQLDIGVGNLAAMCAHLALLGLFFGTLGLTIGAVVGRRSLVFAITAVVGAVAYLANTFLPQIDGAAWTEKTSPFYYYEGGEPLRNGLQIADAGVLLGASLILLGIGAAVFNRRDIAV